MLKGLPASGKSTYAKELVNKGWKRVNKDELRVMIDNGKWSKKNENVIMAIEFAMVASLIRTNHDVVVDSTNFAHEEKWSTLAALEGADFEIKFFDTPISECVERDSKRGEKSVGAKVIFQMYNQYLRPKTPEFDVTLPCTYIFDIDGTLAKMDGRSPYDYTKVSTDVENVNVAQLFRLIADNKVGGNKVIILSGRDSSCRKDTEEWLERYDLKYDFLYMRKSGDNRNDAVVKKEFYDEYIKGKYNVLGVFDDRNRVVDLWRSLGLTCFQVDYGNF